MWDRTAGMVAICEDLPEARDRVTLDPELTDADGIPAPRIDYRLSENSQRMLAHAVARGREVLEAAGAKETFAEAPLRRRLAPDGHRAHGNAIPRPRW